MYRYAQINQEEICIADSNLAGEFNSDDMIPISSTDPSPLGKRYVDGVWEEVSTEPVKPQPTEIMMQSFSGIELQNLEIQQGQQLLAQQLTDLELALPK